MHTTAQVSWNITYSLETHSLDLILVLHRNTILKIPNVGLGPHVLYVCMLYFTEVQK